MAARFGGETSLVLLSGEEDEEVLLFGHFLLFVDLLLGGETGASKLEMMGVSLSSFACAPVEGGGSCLPQPSQLRFMMLHKTVGANLPMNSRNYPISFEGAW